jgi:hypothetical protein
MIPFSVQHHPVSRWEQSIAICAMLISTCSPYAVLHTRQRADEDRCSVSLLLAVLTTRNTLTQLGWLLWQGLC